MKRLVGSCGWIRAVWTLVFCLLTGAGAGVARAQDIVAFSQPELEQMLAPIALYPDTLLSQILMASTYPLEVVEAQRWTVAHPDLYGAAAVQEAAATINWEPSVISLVAFPAVLQAMSDRLDWTERLGNAFLNQQDQVMNTVQVLRRRAYAVGNLTSGNQVVVSATGNNLVIEPTNAQITYVPYYDPTQIYGNWRWSDFPPVGWAPWPGYGYSRGFYWGPGVLLGLDWTFGTFDWTLGIVTVHYGHFRGHGHPGDHDHDHDHGWVAWQHDPAHYRGQPSAVPRQIQRPKELAPGSFTRPQDGLVQPPAGAHVAAPVHVLTPVTPPPAVVQPAHEAAREPVREPVHQAVQQLPPAHAAPNDHGEHEHHDAPANSGRPQAAEHAPRAAEPCARDGCAEHGRSGEERPQR